MEAKVSWQGRMSFTGMGESGFALKLGTDPSVGGDNDGARPMEMIAIGWAGCTAMDVVAILTKKRQDITDFEVKFNGSRAEDHPKIFTGAAFDYIIVGHAVDEAAVLRAIELSTTRYCPANAMLGKLMPTQFHYHIYEDLGEGRRELVKSGEFLPAEAARVSG
jgi:putative redox protein